MEADCDARTNIPLSTGRVHAGYGIGKTFMNPVIDVNREVRRRALRELVRNLAATAIVNYLGIP